MSRVAVPALAVVLVSGGKSEDSPWEKVRLQMKKTLGSKESGRRVGQRAGVTRGATRGQTELAAAAAAAEAAERAANCNAPLFVPDYCPTDEEIERESSAESLCGPGTPEGRAEAARLGIQC